MPKKRKLLELYTELQIKVTDNRVLAQSFLTPEQAEKLPVFGLRLDIETNFGLAPGLPPLNEAPPENNQDKAGLYRYGPINREGINMKDSIRILHIDGDYRVVSILIRGRRPYPNQPLSWKTP